MTDPTPAAVVCVSYLAPAQLLLVDEFPPPNYGAEVVATERGVAADGPMVALTLAAMGLDATLVTNAAGRGPASAGITDQIESSRVRFVPAPRRQYDESPQIVVLSDRAGNRMWLPYLPGVDGELRAADLSPLAGAELAYVDCYDVIRTAARRAILAAAESGTSLFANLGGSEPAPELVELLGRARPAVIQTNVPDDRPELALPLAGKLAVRTRAELVVVTMGAAGAVAVSSAAVRYDVPAYPIRHRRLHGAGAAFSAGLIASLLTGAPLAASLAFAAASGAHQCARPTQATWPSRADVEAFAAAYPRLDVRATQHPAEH